MNPGLKFHRTMDAIPVGTSPEGHSMFRAGRRRAWVLIPVRLPNRLVAWIVKARKCRVESALNDKR